MAISRHLEITITDDTAKFKDRLFVFQDDKNVELYISVKDNMYRFTPELDIMRSLENAYSSATVVKPDGVSFKIPRFPIVDEMIKFTITEAMTDELTEIGTYKIYFHLHDSGEARATIPYVEFEVNEILGDLSDNPIEDNIVGSAIVDETIIKDSIVLQAFECKVYIKTAWKTGDVISAEKLNKIEEGIYKNTESIANIELIPGPQGIPGIQGPKGNDGLIGPQGLPGAKGQDGLNGKDGLPGDKGETGERGLTGPQGQKGDTGAQGIQGECGPKGDTGASGPKGADGVGLDNTIYTTNVSGGILTLTTKRLQKATIPDITEIRLPSVNTYTEIHLFFYATSDLTLILPACKWQGTPSFKANKSYEIVFTYTDKWLAGVIEYA